MAHGIGPNRRYEFHQALHGYSEGHRLLASSTSLAAIDTRTMLVLSDLSGPGASIGDEGYLTGYPLPDAGLYALARTWLATEMPRPGCVWTHTILIDFADLASLSSPAVLLRLFIKPDSLDNLFAFRKSVAVDSEADPFAPVWALALGVVMVASWLWRKS